MADQPNQGSADPIDQGATANRPSGREHSARPSASGSNSGESPLGAGSESDPFAERPEAFVGAAFAGGFALAMLLRRLAR
jgi:hypothetical protein